jgi:hypothetical protein
MVNLGNFVVQKGVRRRLSIHLCPAHNRNADIVLTIYRHYTQHIVGDRACCGGRED